MESYISRHWCIQFYARGPPSQGKNKGSAKILSRRRTLFYWPCGEIGKRGRLGTHRGEQVKLKHPLRVRPPPRPLSTLMGVWGWCPGHGFPPWLSGSIPDTSIILSHHIGCAGVSSIADSGGFSFFTGWRYINRLPSLPVIATQMRSPSSHLRVFQWNSASEIYRCRCFLETA